MPASVRERVYQIVSNVLNVPIEQLSDEAGPDTLPAWDSMSHLNLVLALEWDLGVSLSDEDVTDMLSVGLIHTILAERGITDSPVRRTLGQSPFVR